MDTLGGNQNLLHTSESFHKLKDESLKRTYYLYKIVKYFENQCFVDLNDSLCKCFPSCVVINLKGRHK